MSFAIQKVSIPSKSVSASPRGSKYPIKELIEAGVGYGFGIKLRDENGLPLEGEALKKKAGQRQSQMSGIAKRFGVKLTTRLIEDASKNEFPDVEVPLLGVWYEGAAEPKPAKEETQTAADGQDEAPELPPEE